MTVDELKKRMDDFGFVPGGVERLAAYTDGLRILPAEDSEIHKKAIATEDRALMFDARENALLRMTAEYGKPMAIVVFGSDHDFADNIARWNAEHPDEKISRIVVTPAAYLK
jgi:hypothetical protein